MLFKKKQKNIPHKEELNFDSIQEESVKPTQTGKIKPKKDVKIKAKQNNRKSEKITMTEFYAEKLLNKATRGDLDIQGSQFEISYSKILAETHKKRVIYIYEFPALVHPGHLELLRIELKRLVPDKDKGDVDINICEHAFPHVISFSSKKIMNQEKVFRKRLQMVMNDLQETRKKITDTEALGTRVGRDDLNAQEKKYSRVLRKVQSFEYTSNHQKGGGNTNKSFIFIEVVAKTTELVDECTESVIDLLNKNMYRFREIFELEQYLKDFGIGSLKAQVKPELDVNPMMLTTDISSITSTYTQGIVRSENGDVYLGHSLDTKYPIHFSMSESADSVTILVVADTGGGKTHFCKVLALYTLNHEDNTYNIIANDFKGGEWDKMVPIFGDKGVLISMGVENPKCINTFIVPDYKIFKFRDPKASFQLSFSYSVKLLATLVGLNKANEKKVAAVCTDIVKKVYSNLEVDKDYPETYIKSRACTYLGDVWQAIDYITNESPDMESRHGKETLQDVRISLESYFAPTGGKTYMLENEESIEGMLDKKFIVFDYGTQTVGGQAMLLENEIEARFFQKNYFTTLYTAYRKLRNEYTVEFVEEVQRYLTNPTLARDLNHTVTGGRSSNKINIMLTNTITPILASKDLDQGAIKENINTVIMGRCKEDVAEEVSEYFGLNTALRRMKLVAANNEESGYKYSFLYAFNTGVSYNIEVGSVKLPKHIMKADFMKSRDVEDINKKHEEDYEYVM